MRAGLCLLVAVPAMRQACVPEERKPRRRAAREAWIPLEAKLQARARALLLRGVVLCVPLSAGGTASSWRSPEASGCESVFASKLPFTGGASCRSSAMLRAMAPTVSECACPHRPGGDHRGGLSMFFAGELGSPVCVFGRPDGNITLRFESYLDEDETLGG